MPAVEIRKNVYWIGVNDRTTDLFEGIWPIEKEGVSYNAYLLLDKKKVLIDLSKALKTDEFFNQIQDLVAIQDLDYIVMNHLEPDHTGVLNTFRQINPRATILGTPKMKELLANFYGITENFQVVEDGQTLDIGSRTLQFFHTPFVHWPETMMSYDTSEKILFSCDGFGSYGALVGTIFDDECKNLPFYEQESLRYFVNIVSKFSKPTLNAINKLAGVDVQVIAPSHGLIWRSNPGRIIELYKKWSEYATGPTEPGITLVYGSMYGNTERVMDVVAQGIASAGVPLQIFDAARTHVSYILPALWVNRGVVIGAPTYEGALFPPVTDVLHHAAVKRILNKKTAMFGSHGWSGGALRNIKQIIEPIKWTLEDSFEFTGSPTGEDLKTAREFGRSFAEKIKSGQ
ncbi:MAG: FprA family A-type flavoprotein [Spirochaetales bacterium]|nr:FprA family A-type flavoprotein [Spirochaetales bacterium]